MTMVCFHTNETELKLMNTMQLVNQAGAATCDALRANRELYERLHGDVWAWFLAVPLRTWDYFSRAERMGMEVQDLASECYMKLFFSTDAVQSRLLEHVGRGDYRAAIRYMMSIVPTTAIDVWRKHGKRRDLLAFTELSLAADLADVPDGVASARAYLETVLECMDRDLLDAVGILCKALGYPREEAAQKLLAGRCAELLGQLIACISDCTGVDARSALDCIIDQAARYTPSQAHKANPHSLVTRLYRATNARSLKRLEAEAGEAA